MSIEDAQLFVDRLLAETATLEALWREKSPEEIRASLMAIASRWDLAFSDQEFWDALQRRFGFTDEELAALTIILVGLHDDILA